MSDPRSPRRWLLLACAALGFWAAGFTALYGALSLGCEAGWQSRPLLGSNALTVALVVLWLAQLAALGLGLAALRADLARRSARTPLLRRTALVTTAVALFATLWIGWPTLLLAPCDGAGRHPAPTAEEMTHVP